MKLKAFLVRHFGCLAAGLLCGGCACVSYTSLTPEADSTAKGFRYHDTSPYLLAQRDQNGDWQTQLSYLPDQTKEFQATPHTFLSVNGTSFVFTNSVLTEASSDADASAVPAAVIQTLQQLVSKAYTFTDAEKQVTPPSVQVFKIMKVNGEWGVIGAAAP